MLQPDVVSEYIAEEVFLGHIAGPFTMEETYLKPIQQHEI